MDIFGDDVVRGDVDMILGPLATLSGATQVSHSDWGQVWRISTSQTPFMVKVAAPSEPQLLLCEAEGLQALARAARDSSIKVPEVIGVTPRTLVTEWVQESTTASFGTRNTSPDTALGEGLAMIHLSVPVNDAATSTTRRSDNTQHFGAIDDREISYLGPVQVQATPSSTWREFYLFQRLEPLLRQAIATRAVKESILLHWHELLPHADELCGPEEPPSLLHGDLWAGNRLVDTNNRNWLIDPGCYWGHREVDIAMMHLFGGFSASCFDAYDQIASLAEGWRHRMPWYQLQPLLVHAIVFGSGYGEKVERIIEQYRHRFVGSGTSLPPSR